MHALLATFLTAFLVPQDFFISSSGEPQLTRARDLNGNGSANDPGEFTKCVYDPTQLKQGYEVRATSIFGAPALLWLENDPTLRKLVRLQDSNGNGVFEPGETTTIATLPILLGLNDNSVCFFGSCVEGNGGSVFVSNNQLAFVPWSTGGIYKLGALNTGTPTGASAILRTDTVQIYENFQGTQSGTTTLGGSFERIGWIPATQTLLGYNTLDDCIYAMRDLDADGAFRTAGEFVNWLNAANHKSGIAKSGDFFGGALASYGTLFNSIAPGPNNFGNRFTFHYLATDPISGAIYVGSRRGNANSLAAGKIFRCLDLNGNGTCNDAGEVKVYVDDQSAGTFIDPASGMHYAPSAASGPNNYGFQGMTVDPSTGIVFALSTVGPVSASGLDLIDIVWKLVDLNSDGDANDPNEQIPVFFQRPSGSVSRALEVVPAGMFQAPFAAASVHLPGGFQTTTPFGSCTTPAQCGVRFYKGAPYLGNSDFQISVSGVLPGISFAQLWVSQADWDSTLVKQLWDALNGPPNFLGLSYPGDLSSRNLDEWLALGIWMSPSPMFVDLFDLAGTGTFQLDNIPGGLITGAGGVSGAPAYADPLNSTCAGTPFLGRFDANIPIPNNPILIGQSFRVQWHVDDPSTPFPGAFRTVSDLGFIVIE